MRILVVDDDPDTQRLLQRYLTRWGHDVILASNGVEAWEILKKEESLGFIISDWMMPEMNGLELCKKIRAADFSHYIYIILLTAKDAKNDLIEGMEAGADDFIVKPFNVGELKVRIRAGERIIKLEHDLEERNRKLSAAYDVIRKDLEAAAKLQKNLLPASSTILAGIKFDWLFIPSTFLAGDIFNYFLLDETHVGFYLLDVAGHGIPAAMLSVTISKMLSPENQFRNQQNYTSSILTETRILSPSQVISYLNQKFQNENDAMQYFTMIYGIIDTKKHEIQISQAAHPSPLLIKRSNGIILIGDGGFPVGMLPNMDYENKTFPFQQGDRLFVYSDGVIECANKNREIFTVERLIDFLKFYRNTPLDTILQKLKQELINWHGSEDFKDDVSILVMEG